MYLQLPISLPKITNFHLSTIILMFDKQKKKLLSFIINFFSEVNNLVFQDKTFLMYIKYNLKITNCPCTRVFVMKGCLWHITYSIVLSKTVKLGQTRKSHLFPSIFSLYGMVKKLLCMQFSNREGNRETALAILTQMLSGKYLSSYGGTLNIYIIFFFFHIIVKRQTHN